MLEERLAQRCSAQRLQLLTGPVTRVKDFSILVPGLLILVGTRRLGSLSGWSSKCEARRAGVTPAAILRSVSRGDLGKPLHLTALLFPVWKKSNNEISFSWKVSSELRWRSGRSKYLSWILQAEPCTARRSSLHTWRLRICFLRCIRAVSGYRKYCGGCVCTVEGIPWKLIALLQVCHPSSASEVLNNGKLCESFLGLLEERFPPKPTFETQGGKAQTRSGYNCRGNHEQQGSVYGIISHFRF